MVGSERLKADLQSEQCRCGEAKQRVGLLFCTRCYGLLPKAYTDRLYRCWMIYRGIWSAWGGAARAELRLRVVYTHCCSYLGLLDRRAA